MQYCSPETLRRLLQYQPDTGQLVWLPRDPMWFSPVHPWTHKIWNKRWAGVRAFTAIKKPNDPKQQYYVGAVLNVNYRACRVAWAIHHGEWPQYDVDHVNGNTLDDRIENLRDVPNAINHRNEAMSRNNTSGHNGVYWDRQTGKWRALIKVGFKSICLGRHVNFADAVAARKAADIRYGFTDRHGLPLDVSPRPTP